MYPWLFSPTYDTSINLNEHKDKESDVISSSLPFSQNPHA